MPIYSYRWTDAQGGTFDEFQKMVDDPLSEYRGRPCERTIHRAAVRTQYGAGSGTNPIKMLSIGVDSIEEVHAFRRRNPGVDISDNPNDEDFGVPVARSRTQKLRILANEGFQETN